MFHLSSFVRQFRPSYVGRGAKTKVVSGDEKLDKLRGHFYVSQMFGSPSSKLLETFFTDAAHYSAGTKKLVGRIYGCNSILNNLCENDTYPSVADTKESNKRKSLDGYENAMLRLQVLGIGAL